MKKSLAIIISLALILSGCSASKVSTTSAKDSTQPNKSSTTSTEDKKNTITQVVQTAPTSQKPVETSQTAENSPKAVTPVVTNFTPVILNSTAGLKTQNTAWSWAYSPKSAAPLLSKYFGYAFGDTSKKVIYLTFDEGYENWYTASILDPLKKNDVHAAFFNTLPFVNGSYKGVQDTELLKRMMNEGHLICNHSVQHKSMPSFLDEKSFDAEITGVENKVNSIPGLKMSKFFRPPMGDFSELSLYYTQKLGYKSIFFSLAYTDYDTEHQPDPTAAKALLLKNTKPGMICLLHAVSKTNAEILDSLLKEWKAQGYEFKTLDKL